MKKRALYLLGFILIFIGLVFLTSYIIIEMEAKTYVIVALGCLSMIATFLSGLLAIVATSEFLDEYYF